MSLNSSHTPLSRAFSRYRVAMISVFAFGFFVNLLLFTGPIYMLQVYDRVLSSRSESTLIAITGMCLGLLLAYGLLEWVRARMLARAGARFDEVLAEPLFDRVVRVQLASADAGGSAALGDADKLRDFISGQGILAFFDAPFVPLFLVLCYSFHPLLGMVALTGALVIFVLALVNEFGTRAALSQSAQSEMQAGSFAEAALQNSDTIRAMGMGDALVQRWLALRDGMLRARVRAADRTGLVLAASKFTRMALQIAILGCGAYLAMSREISPGIMVAASIIMGRALAPVEQAVGQWRHFVGARQAHRRLAHLFKMLPATPQRTQMPAPKGKLEVEGLAAFAAASRESILRGVTFGAQPGDCVAVIGPSGSGKTTLLRHLVGVSEPVTGSVSLDGLELRLWDAGQLGRSLGYLPQEIRLFSGTVAENIARFQPDARDEDIVEAARLAGADAVIANLRDGYQTQIGAGGHQLSGGQRQRIALARAVFGAPCLVVLDEPNAHLDHEGEVALARCLQSLKARGCTLVVVTHKAKLLKLCDKTLLIKDGAMQRFGYTSDLVRPEPRHVGGNSDAG